MEPEKEVVNRKPPLLFRLIITATPITELFPLSLPPLTMRYVLYSEKQSRSNSRWMRLISPSNNRRELVLLSRLAQTMAIHANPLAKQSRQYSACESPRPPSTYPSSFYTFYSFASAVGAQ